MSEKINVEKISGSLCVGAAATAVAALGGTITPLAAFVPFLVQSLASGRQSERLESTLNVINGVIERQSELIEKLSDDQYKVINEAVSAAFYTIDEKKLEYLVRVVENSARSDKNTRGESDFLSRIIRDISAEEILFVLSHFQYNKIMIYNEEVNEEGVLAVRKGSREELLITGLINMGLLYSRDSNWDVQAYLWSPVTVKVIYLLEKNKEN